MSDYQTNDIPPQPNAPGLDNTASYQKRFLAAVIDLVLMVIVLMFVWRFLGLEFSNTADWQSMEAELVKKMSALSDSQKVFLAFSPYLIFLGLHGFLLYQYGQTVGKKLVGIAIVTLENQKPAFMPLIIQRYFSQWLMGMVPVAALPLRLADILFIFRNDKRCLHDLIARTKVIDLSIKVVAAPNSFIA